PSPGRTRPTRPPQSAATSASLLPPPPGPARCPYTTLFRSPVRGDHQDGQLAFPGGEVALIAQRGAERLQRPADRRAEQHRVERRSEEHTSELQSRENLVCRLLLEKKKETLCSPSRTRRRLG